MFCPNCGEADQKKETYCRKCGTYLAEFGKTKLTQRPVDENFKATTFLNALTGITSLVLAIILYVVFFGKADTPIIIYVVAGFLTAMFAWQVQTFLRTLQLKKQYKQREGFSEDGKREKQFVSKETNELLPEADFSDVVPASVTENTTRHLNEKVKRSTKSEQ